MAKIDLTIPSLSEKLIDLRDSIPGDSYNWSWTRPLAQIKYLAIHHTGGPDTQTPEQIANFHLHSNGWGGIGYHFLIAKDGTVYYVGDISTARANVANLNEQVLGICLIGNFTNGRNPTEAQIESVRKLVDFFINHYPALSNVKTWDSVRGHKDLPGQSTICPGEDWSNWRSSLISSGNDNSSGSIVFNGSSDRKQKVADLYRIVLGREPDEGGLQTYVNSPTSIDGILKSMVSSQEHRNVLAKVKDVTFLESQVSNLQDVINKQNQQVSSMNSTITALQEQLNMLKVEEHPVLKTPEVKDTTFTLVDALFNLFRLFFPAREGKIA